MDEELRQHLEAMEGRIIANIEANNIEAMGEPFIDEYVRVMNDNIRVLDDSIERMDKREASGPS